MKKIILQALLFAASTCLAQVTVSVSTPQANSTVTSPMSIQATATSSKAITGWQVYLDGSNVTSGAASNTLSTSVSMANGTHQVVIRAWDASGAYNSQTLNVTASASALPTPPSTAIVFTNIDQLSGWSSCGSAACAGGYGTSAFWQAFNQTAPSIDGNSMQLYNQGVWANALWWKHLGANDSATNMLWDFYVYVDGSAATYGQALEYDMYQFVNGYNYMVGTQCDYGYGVWDTWSEANGNWIHTNIACPKFSAGSWHHIQWYVTLNHTNHSYTYKTLVVDGNAYTVNQTQYAQYLAWPDNLGVQYQVDVNAQGGGVHEWIDSSKLTIW